MKKNYIAPEIEVVQLKIHGMLAASPPLYGGEGGAPSLDPDAEEMRQLLFD